MQLNDVAAIVTGGASGLGGATAARLVRSGAKVTIFDLDEAGGGSHSRRVGATFFKVDVTDETSVSAALKSAEASNGVARILVNCAGVAPVAKTVGRDSVAHLMGAFRRTIEINLVGSFLVASRFAARLATADCVGEERGVIINTASVAAYDGQVGQVAYAASKSGVAGMTLPLARDLAQHQIRVVAIAPGLFLTPMLMGLPQAAQDSLGQRVPHPNRLGMPEEYAQLVEAILCNPMLNGEVIRLDGAIRMAPR